MPLSEFMRSIKIALATELERAAGGYDLADAMQPRCTCAEAEASIYVPACALHPFAPPLAVRALLPRWKTVMDERTRPDYPHEHRPADPVRCTCGNATGGLRIEPRPDCPIHGYTIHPSGSREAYAKAAAKLVEAFPGQVLAVQPPPVVLFQCPNDDASVTDAAPYLGLVPGRTNPPGCCCMTIIGDNGHCPAHADQTPAPKDWMIYRSKSHDTALEFFAKGSEDCMRKEWLARDRRFGDWILYDGERVIMGRSVNGKELEYPSGAPGPFDYSKELRPFPAHLGGNAHGKAALLAKHVLPAIQAGPAAKGKLDDWAVRKFNGKDRHTVEAVGTEEEMRAVMDSHGGHPDYTLHDWNGQQKPHPQGNSKHDREGTGYVGRRKGRPAAEQGHPPAPTPEQQHTDRVTALIELGMTEVDSFDVCLCLCTQFKGNGPQAMMWRAELFSNDLGRRWRGECQTPRAAISKALAAAKADIML